MNKGWYPQTLIDLLCYSTEPQMLFLLRKKKKKSCGSFWDEIHTLCSVLLVQGTFNSLFATFFPILLITSVFMLWWPLIKMEIVLGGPDLIQRILKKVKLRETCSCWPWRYSCCEFYRHKELYSANNLNEFETGLWDPNKNCSPVDPFIAAF